MRRGPEAAVSRDGGLGALLGTSRALERAVAECEFEAALELQDDLRMRIEAFVLAWQPTEQGRGPLEDLSSANERLLAQAEQARATVLRALLELGQRRRAVRSYAEAATPR